MARQNGSDLLKQSGRRIRISGSIRASPLRPADKGWLELRQQVGPAVVIGSTSPQLGPGLALLT
jgi:hypothetical protein